MKKKLGLIFILGIFILMEVQLNTFASDKGQKTFSVLEYGAIADAKTDVTGSFQKALDEAGKTGGTVIIPPGQYLIAGQIAIPTGVCLQGSWEMAHHGIFNKGTVLFITGGKGDENGKPAIIMEQSSAVKGITFFYPEQNIDDLKPYPWTIRGKNMHNTIENITLVNAWQGIDMGYQWNELHVIRNVFGCVLKTGVYISITTDVGRVENVHFNPHYWLRSGAPNAPSEANKGWNKLLKHIRNNATAFIIGRSDWESFLNTFSYGYHIGYHFIQTKDGSCNGSFVGIGADANELSVVIDGLLPYGTMIQNGTFVAHGSWDPLHPEEIVAIVISSTNSGPVMFQNCSFFGNMDNIAKISGTGNVNFNNCNFRDWARKNNDQPAIIADGGNLIVTGCNFNKVADKILLNQGLISATITGNNFFGSEKIINNSDGNVVIGLNGGARKPKPKPGQIIIDNQDGEPDFKTEGDWYYGVGGNDYYMDCKWAHKGDGSCKARFTPDIPEQGKYAVYIWYGGDPGKDHSTYLLVQIHNKKGLDTAEVDLTKNIGQWNLLGEYNFEKGRKGYVEIDNKANGNIVADAIMFERK
jgi:hypothetical protein